MELLTVMCTPNNIIVIVISALCMCVSFSFSFLIMCLLKGSSHQRENLYNDTLVVFGDEKVVEFHFTVLCMDVKNVLLLCERGPEECPLRGGCPFRGGSFMGCSTIVL